MALMNQKKLDLIMKCAGVVLSQIKSKDFKKVITRKDNKCLRKASKQS